MSYQDCTSTCSDATVCEADGKSKFAEEVSKADDVLGKPSNSYNLAEWRALRRGPGAQCEPEHLGAVLNLSSLSPSAAAS